jgi:glycosyltransferase involved in cell wall biosynthesis
MRVVHFTRWFSALSETFIYDSITELERQGLDNHVIALERHNEQSRPFSKVETLSRPGRYHPLGFADRVISRLRRRPANEDSWIGLRAKLLRAVRDHRPKIIHAHFGQEASLIAPLATRLSVPLVVSFYGYDISRLALDPWWRKRYEKLWQETAAFVVLSHEMLETVVRLGGPVQRLHIVHLARRMDEPPPSKPHRPIRNFLSVGRLVEKKGHFDAIRAIHLLAKKYPDLHLDIIGEGPFQVRLERLVAELQLSGRVSLLGPLSSEETLRRMHKAHAFLLCSKTGADGDKEGTPTVLVEAQHVGLPFVSTFHAGIPEMVPHENHQFLAAEGNVNQVAERMEWIMNAQPHVLERMTLRGQIFVRQNFNLSVEVAKLASLYQSLLEESLHGEKRASQHN